MKQLSKPDNRTLEALARANVAPECRDLMAWLRKSLEQLATAMEEEYDEIQLRRHQGAAQALREILHHCENAREMVEKR